jgi:regulatory protein
VPIVTALERQARHKDRYNLFVDGEFALALHGDLAREARLTPGRRLTAEELRDLRGREAYQTALDSAYRFLAYRPRSESEVRTRLRRAKVDDTTISVVVAKLREQRFLDDAAFAQSWTESRQNHSPRSRRMLQFELRRKGVAQDVAETAAAEVEDGDAAYRAAEARARRMRDMEFESFQKRLGDFLLRRGFSYAIARRTVQQLWSERV